MAGHDHHHHHHHHYYYCYYDGDLNGLCLTFNQTINYFLYSWNQRIQRITLIISSQWDGWTRQLHDLLLLSTRYLCSVHVARVDNTVYKYLLRLKCCLLFLLTVSLLKWPKQKIHYKFQISFIKILRTK